MGNPTCFPHPCVGLLVFSPLLTILRERCPVPLPGQGGWRKISAKVTVEQSLPGLWNRFSQGEFGLNWGMTSPETLQEG